jgi:hypothetical protein
LLPLSEHALADLAKLGVRIGEFAHLRCRSRTWESRQGYSRSPSPINIE